MSATDELRRLLTAAGVEWWPLDGTPDMTECIVDGVRHKYRPVGRGIIWSSCTEVAVKPEQAIAATLGVSDATPTRQGDGTCHNESKCPQMFFYCSECGCAHKRNRAYVDMPRFCPNCGAKVVDS